MPLAPVNDEITIEQLTRDPYPIYKRLRAESPVLEVKAVNRIMLTKAADTRAVKDNGVLWSSDDPNTPMTRAFETQTLMRKDGEEHKAERNAMMPTFSPKNLKGLWGPLYEQLAGEYLDRLPRDEVVDLFPMLASPLACNILSHILGIPEASDADMARWSQALIDGAGNFGNVESIFLRSDQANKEINALLDKRIPEVQANPDESAFSVMVNAEDPIVMGQIRANIKIAIGGGINEPRDALLTILYGLLTNPEQLEEVKRQEAWGKAFEEGVRWVAPIQVSGRRATEDTEIRGITIKKDQVVQTIQASANWDEDIYDEPEKYIVFRDKNPHQAFGSGPHHCMGTHLARLMLGKTLLPMLFERFPNMELVEPESVVWNGFGFRGPLNLPVRLN